MASGMATSGVDHRSRRGPLRAPARRPPVALSVGAGEAGSGDGGRGLQRDSCGVVGNEKGQARVGNEMARLGAVSLKLVVSDG
jgi:hypothetical protein